MRSCSWRWNCTARSTLSNGLPFMNASLNTSKMYTCTLLSAFTPSGGLYTRARAARTFSPDIDPSSLRPLSVSTHGGLATVQPVDDAHQIEHMIHVVVGAGFLGVERVAVAREHRAHAEPLGADDVALGPVADHHRLRGL